MGNIELSWIETLDNSRSSRKNNLEKYIRKMLGFE